MLSIKDFSLSAVTPENLKNDQKIKAITSALDYQLKQITTAISETGIFYAIDNLSGSVLDLLAFSLHVDFYELAHNDETKRNFIKSSIISHMKKGTSAAIIDALKLIGVDAKFIHWKDFDGKPYTFKIDANITGDFYRTAGREKIISSILTAIEESKSARSLLVGLSTKLSFCENSLSHIGLASFLSGQEKIFLSPQKDLDNATIFTGIAAGVFAREILRPCGGKEIHLKTFVGFVPHQSHSLTIGVSLKIMQELLTQFEKRIFSRLDALEKQINDNISIQNKNISDGLSKIESLLLWKGDDEELS